MRALLAVTPGEPAGIGPDICLRYMLASHQPTGPEPVFFADPGLLAERARQLAIDIKIRELDLSKPVPPAARNTISVVPFALRTPCEPGKLNADNAAYVLETLSAATQACLHGHCQALITGPVQKSIINEAGHAFSGHTEFLADLCQRDTVVMMLATDKLKVALVTTHLPLSAVPTAITSSRLQAVIRILHSELIAKFGIASPRILVAGLNPHAGENGHLGREEIETISPVLAALRKQGMQLQGPLPADTLFTPKYLQQADAVLAMYHDQGLPVLKYQGFGTAVNITLGLPIIRTSVDHGTALDLAGSGNADHGSLAAAIASAALMSRHWQTPGK